MPTFRYKGVRAAGGDAAGTIEAETVADAGRLLKGKGIYATEITAAATAKRSLRKGVALPELALMTRRLSTLVGSAVPVFEAVATLYDQEAPGELKNVLGRVRDRLAEGGSLAAAMAAEPAVFGESYVSMVAAGEAGGALETILDRLADFLEDQQSVRSRITTALAYPVLMALVGTGVMLFLLAFVIPRIVGIFEQNKAALPFITVALIAISSGLRKWWWVLLIIAGGITWLYRRMLPDEDFRLRRDRVLLKLPLAGNLMRRLVLARFARVLGLLLESGVPMIRAVEITGDVVVNREYRYFLTGVREKLAEGKALSATLKESDLFPPLMVHMISVGEKGGTLEEMLVKAGVAYEKEFDTAITRSMSLLEPLLVLGMGLAVGIVVIAVLLPIFELNQLVK